MRGRVAFPATAMTLARKDLLYELLSSARKKNQSLPEKSMQSLRLI
jgi:hypothetical protein